MANMTHKSVEASRVRRNRHVEALRPVKELFHCTAAQAVVHVRTVLDQNVSLRTKKDQLEEQVRQLEKQVQQLQNSLVDKERELKVQKLKQLKQEETP